MKALEEEVTEEKETLRLYPLEEGFACVSIGHMDYRARFYFKTNEDALDCYNALRKISAMDIE